MTMVFELNNSIIAHQIATAKCVQLQQKSKYRISSETEAVKENDKNVKHRANLKDTNPAN